MIGAILVKKAVKSGFDALSNRNLDKFMKSWDKECVWIYPGTMSVSGTFTGKKDVTKWFQHFQDQFPTSKFTVTHLGVENIFDLIGNNVIYAQWELELVNQAGVSYKNTGVTVLTIKGSKVVRGEDFLSTSGGEEFKKLWGE